MTLALIFAILNAARGRKWLWLWAEEVNGRTRKRGNDWVWATICGLIATIAAMLYGHGWWAAFIAYTVTLGLRLGESPGHSLDEFRGEFDPGKYPPWVENVGLFVFPLDGYQRTNKKRAWLMRTVKSVYYYPLFIALAFINPWSLLIGTMCFLIGTIYAIVGMFGEREHSVGIAELGAGALLGFLIEGVIGAGA